MADIGSSNKRMKCSSSYSVNNISDLGEELISIVASFLAVPSQLLFAISLTAPSSSPSWRAENFEPQLQLSAASKAIVSCRQEVALQGVEGNNSQWAVIDFGDVEYNLAEELQDDDIYAMLVCIDAKNTLKRLRMCGCRIVTGSGLEPLRESMALEQIDLRPLRIEGGERSSRISEENALPILQSIVSINGNSLKHVQPFEAWRGDGDSIFGRFHTSYNRHLSREITACSKCGNDLHKYGQMFHPSRRGYCQTRTCSKCLNHFCRDRECKTKYCDGCKKFLCGDCASWCKECHRCSGCTGPALKLCGGSCGYLVCGTHNDACVICGKNGCKICFQLKQCCNLCTNVYCRDCTTVCYECGDCSVCSGSNPEVCDKLGCGHLLCKGCSVVCKHCNLTGCKTCLGLIQCEGDNCNTECCLLCVEENIDHWCTKCDEQLCSDCFFTACEQGERLLEGCEYCIGRYKWMQRMQRE